jgi:GtrA-like protein
MLRHDERVAAAQNAWTATRALHERVGHHDGDQRVHAHAGDDGVRMTPWIANVIATSIATGPRYTLNRRWTWGLPDASDPWRQVAPFWLLSFAGLGLSTLAVAVTDSYAAQMHLAGVVRTGAVLGAHLSGFAIL